MPETDRDAIESFLLEIEGARSLFKGYRLCMEAEGSLCLLGTGGYSSVYEMYEEANPSKRYALKVIGFGRHTLMLEDFLEVVKMQKWFGEQSPNILQILNYSDVRIYTIYEDYRIEDHTNGENGRFLILMEKLQEIISKEKFQSVRLNRKELRTEAEVLAFAKQIGSAVWLMHQNHVLHRDIKLENIFWDEKNQLYKLGDFDIARYTESDTAETMVYTNGYGAPEVGYGPDEEYDATADIYSFGIVLYLLLNDLCFPGSDGYHVNMVQYSPDFVFPAARNASQELNRVIRKMCKFDRNERYQSMAEVLAELEAISVCACPERAEQGTELADMTTETYRDPGLPENDREIVLDKNGEKRSRREQERLIKKAGEMVYRDLNIKYIVVLSLLFALLLRSLYPDVLMTQNWRFWIFPIVVLAEVVFIRLKEFHITVGVAIVLFDIYAMVTTGSNVPYILVLLCMILGVRGIYPIMIGGATGTILWLISLMIGKISWIDFLSKLELGWLILGVLMVLFYRYVVERYCLVDLEYISDRGDGNRIHIWDKLPVVILVLGIILRILGCFSVIAVPEVLEQLHFIGAGVVGIIGNRLIKDGIL